MLALLLAAQLFGEGPMPSQIEPMANRYLECANSRFQTAIMAEVERDERVTRTPGTELMTAAFRECSAVRQTATVEADRALASVRGFEDSSYRRDWIKRFFDDLGQFMVDGLRPENDPDCWAPDGDSLPDRCRAQE